MDGLLNKVIRLNHYYFVNFEYRRIILQYMIIISTRGLYFVF